MIKKLLSTTKRPLLNLLALAVIAAVGFAAFRFYQSGQNPDGGISALPALKTIKPVPDGLIIDLKRKEIGVALVVSSTASYDDIASDVITVYRWGREQFSPLLCGPLAPPNMCIDGRVLIYLVTPAKVPSTQGTAEVYVKVIGMWLDQQYIEVLLTNPPQTLDDLGAFHEFAYKDSLGTGAYIATEFANPIFQYKNLTDFSLR